MKFIFGALFFYSFLGLASSSRIKLFDKNGKVEGHLEEIELVGEMAQKITQPYEIQLKQDKIDKSTLGPHKIIDTKALVINVKEGSIIPVGICANTPGIVSVSPNKDFTARSIVKNCGASVDFATHVFLEKGKNFESIFVLSGKPKISFKWKAENSLEVSHSKLNEDEVFKRIPMAFGIKISEKSTIERIGHTEIESLKSGNSIFAATFSKTSGVEFAQRVAGWSQEASGLYLESWGRWDGKEPFGDDPLGREQFKEK